MYIVLLKSLYLIMQVFPELPVILRVTCLKVHVNYLKHSFSKYILDLFLQHCISQLHNIKVVHSF